jgi:hypothetical protein
MGVGIDEIGHPIGLAVGAAGSHRRIAIASPDRRQ